MSSQSGALGLAILDYARSLNIGFSTFVSVGNKADVSGNDLIQYWAEDPNTDVILLYLESFGNPRKFGEIARRVARQKPIVAVKAGRSAAGARAAPSHTGALATSDAIVVGSLPAGRHHPDRTRSRRCSTSRRVLATQPLPAGRRVGIVTNAGGPGILAADACEANGLELAPLSDGDRGASARVSSRGGERRQSGRHDRLRVRRRLSAHDAAPAGRSRDRRRDRHLHPGVADGCGERRRGHSRVGPRRERQDH